MILDADFVYLECGAAFEVEPDFELDITAVDTTLVGDDDVQPFYPKEMKHGGFDMSKLFLFKLIFFIMSLFYVGLKDVRNTSKFGWTARFNMELNHAFPNVHPSMTEFVRSTIRRTSADKYKQNDRVAKGREQATVHQPANLFTVPAAHYTFAYVAPIF